MSPPQQTVNTSQGYEGVIDCGYDEIGLLLDLNYARTANICLVATRTAVRRTVENTAQVSSSRIQGFLLVQNAKSNFPSQTYGGPSSIRAASIVLGNHAPRAR